MLLPMVDNTDPKGMPEKYPEFASRVQAAMQTHRISIKDIRLKLNISYEMARRYALGQALPRPDKIHALAEILQLSPQELQFGDDENGTKKKPGGHLQAVPFIQHINPELEFVAKLMILVAQSTPDGRNIIMDAAISCEKISDVNGRITTANQPK